MSYENSYFPNQRAINIHRDTVVKKSGRNYACIYKDNLLEACRNLKPSTFKLWVWLASNQNNYSLEYSPSYIQKVLHMSIPTAKGAFNELKEKLYLIQDDNKDYLFHFYEEPQKVEEKREVLNPYTGEYEKKTYQQIMNLYGYVEGIKIWMGANEYE